MDSLDRCGVILRRRWKGQRDRSITAGEEFGELRIGKAIESGASTTAELIERLLDAAAVFSEGTQQSDDMTAVAVRVR